MELWGLDMVAHQLPAITDAAVIAGNINFGVNIKNWLVAQLGPIFLVVALIGVIVFAVKRQMAGLLGWIIVCALLSVFVFSPDIFKDLGTKLYNLVFK
ncbi:hypothetical protein [Bacillus toyonensis]|uniref:hypothetical protein n=1 Tax=Bacillus toyonensis TaxID=155322 RepID=UPI0018A15F63|nr:hypothetical protein [Bacillus toyonensis]MBF7149789.1 hypothetical protein [Bacillus toyonensis]MEC2351462.1 hypothetical protein [Bacillus toyonensis]MED3188712.1 hypothetical protein [Bacillus toyonensis]